ncbi:MAG: TonB-dependent receptor [Acidobacteriales bacterium]|nr:TonB-dependent receptor [Terriglobales bacterium]
MSRTHVLRCAMLLSLVLLLSASMMAQYGASIQGTISDKSGAVVPGATITVTNQATGVSRSTVAGDTGFYRVSALIPGVYTVEVTSGHFKKSTAKEVQVVAESVRGLNVTLEPGGVMETVTVTVTAAGAETENANISAEITAKDIQRMPSYGRDPYELLRLAPGVFGDGARTGIGSAANFYNTSGPGASTNSIFSVENVVQVTANGQRPSGNNFTIDGASVNSLTWGGAAVLTPNQESIAEVKILSTDYSAEDGRNTGAQIKAISKTGTNQFHGSGFFDYDEPGLNAYSRWGGYSDGRLADGTCPADTPHNCTERVSNKNRQFGGSIGGPIWKDKIFFFFSYEGNRKHSSTNKTQYIEAQQFVDFMKNTRPNSVETALLTATNNQPRILQVLTPDCNDFKGQWPNYTYSPGEVQGADGSGCQVISGGVDLGGLGITGADPTWTYGQYVPTWNILQNTCCVSDTTAGGFDGVPDMQKVLFLNPSTLSGNQYNTRIDFNHGKNQFAGSFYLTPYDYTQPSTGNARVNQDINSKWRNGLVTFLWNRNFSPSLLNEARFNATRWSNNEYKINSQLDWGLPEMKLEGIPLDVNFWGPPQGDNSPGVFAQNQFEFRDVLSKVHGRHGLKAGFNYNWIQDNTDYMFGDQRPIYAYHGIWELANGAPIYEGVNANPITGAFTDNHKYFRQHDIAWFIQDDLKLRSNLTINIGLRYEYFSPLSDKHGQLANLFLNPVSDYVDGLANATVKVSNPLYPSDKNNFSPRLGFAWSPSKFSNRAVFRGGFGVGYNRITDTMTGISRVNAPFVFRYGICCAAAGTSSIPTDKCSADAVNTYDLLANCWMALPYAPNGVGNQIVVVQGSSQHSITGYPANPALAFDPNTGGPYGKVEIWGAPQNFSTPYVYSYSLDFQYELPHDFVATLGYQGSSSHRILRIVNLENVYQHANAHYGAVYFPSTDAKAHYNALLANLKRNFSHGVQMFAKYRWSKSMDTVTGEGAGGYTNQFYPLNQNAGDFGPSDFDATHSFSLSALWDLPFPGSKDSWTYKLLGGWHIDPTFQFHSGFPWSAVMGWGCPPVPSGTNNICPSLPKAYLGGAGQDYSTSTFQKPGGNFPNGGSAYFDMTSSGPPFVKRNSFRGPRYQAFDVSLGKETRVPFITGEGARIDFRANFFNLFNKLNLNGFGYSTPSTNIRDNHFGTAGGAFAGRVVEFQARLNF